MTLEHSFAIENAFRIVSPVKSDFVGSHCKFLFKPENVVFRVKKLKCFIGKLMGDSRLPLSGEPSPDPKPFITRLVLFILRFGWRPCETFYCVRHLLPEPFLSSDCSSISTDKAVKSFSRELLNPFSAPFLLRTDSQVSSSSHLMVHLSVWDLNTFDMMWSVSFLDYPL